MADFIPAHPGSTIFAVYRSEDKQHFDVCKFPCLFFMVDADKTVPMGLFDLPRGTVYVGLQHEDKRVSVAFDNFVYENEGAFLRAASKMLDNMGLHEPRSWETSKTRKRTAPKKRKHTAKGSDLI